MNGQIINADCLDWMREQPSDSVDLVFGSPPYEAARTYGIGFKLKGQEWVDWMVERIVEMVRICKGLVAMVVEGQTRKFRWSATPALLMADLHRRGIYLRKPPAFSRVGIPGSGGPDFLRNDYEFVVCCTKGKLPWSDNTAMGHPPKWAPGGEMSNRHVDGRRKNARGYSGNQWGKYGGPRGMGNRKANGNIDTSVRPSHVHVHTKSDGTQVLRENRKVINGHKPGMHARPQSYTVPVLANPGNIIKCIVGGGVMGSKLSAENEAPFPERLAEFFVRSFCPPDGTVLDPFSGSGTTARVAQRFGRRFIALDVRQSQCELTARRLAEPERNGKPKGKRVKPHPAQASLFD